MQKENNIEGKEIGIEVFNNEEMVHPLNYKVDKSTREEALGSTLAKGPEVVWPRVEDASYLSLNVIVDSTTTWVPLSIKKGKNPIIYKLT